MSHICYSHLTLRLIFTTSCLNQLMVHLRLAFVTLILLLHSYSRLYAFTSQHSHLHLAPPIGGHTTFNLTNLVVSDPRHKLIKGDLHLAPPIDSHTTFNLTNLVISDPRRKLIKGELRSQTKPHNAIQFWSSSILQTKP